MSLEQTPCDKCYGGHYGKPIYSRKAGFTEEQLAYFCDKCGHKKTTPVKSANGEA